MKSYYCENNEQQEFVFENPYPASDYVNLQCYCDLGKVPNTYAGTNIGFSLTEKSVTCYNSWNLTYKWATADFDGSNEKTVDGQTSLSFSHSVDSNNPFLLVLSLFAKIDSEDVLVSQCRTAVQTNKGTEGFYSLRQGGPNDGFIDVNERTDIYFHYYKERKLDSTELKLQTADITLYDINEPGKEKFQALLTSQSIAYNIR